MKTKEKRFVELMNIDNIKVFSDSFPHRIFYYNKNGEWIMKYNKRFGCTWICYNIWSVFEKEYDMIYIEIQDFFKKMLFKYFNQENISASATAKDSKYSDLKHERENINYTSFLKITELKDNNIIACFIYGSRTYGNYNKFSDFDFICVVKTKEQDQFILKDSINVNFYTAEEHQNRIDEHEISALETLWLEPAFILKQEQKFEFNLDLKKLRRSLSAKSSNSFVKCKKKLTIEKDLDINNGIKSMFHAFRIIDFGIQIANTGKINNYDSCNLLYEKLVYYKEWDKIVEDYKPLYNNKLTEFRKLAPK